MTPERLCDLLSQVVAEAVDDGTLPVGATDTMPAPALRPVDGRSAGVVADWVSPLVRRWAPDLGLSLLDLAQVLAPGLTGRSEVEAVEVTPAGLMAITLTDLCRAEILVTIAADEHFACDHQDETGEHPQLDTTVQGAVSRTETLASVRSEHARLRRVIRNAVAGGVSPRAVDHRATLNHVSERSLLVALADLPQRLDRATGDPARQARALTDLAATSRASRRPTRPALVGERVTPEHGARLTLAQATALVLRNGLRRLGVDAPERM